MWLFPVNLDVRNEPGEENEIDITVAKNLIRDMDIATFCVSRGWQHELPSYAPSNLIIRLFVFTRRCPLLALSGHSANKAKCPLLGVTRT
jgi:hypothetical protein